MTGLLGLVVAGERWEGGVYGILQSCRMSKAKVADDNRLTGKKHYKSISMHVETACRYGTLVKWSEVEKGMVTRY